MRDKEKIDKVLCLKIFIPFSLAYFLSVLLGSANSIMSPILIETFALSPTDLGFMSSVYLVAFGIAQFPIGVLLDLYGGRETLIPLLTFAVMGTLIFAVSESYAMLVLSKIFLGIGMAGCLMAAFKTYSQWMPAKKLPLIYSFHSLAGGIGGMVATRPLAYAFEIIQWRHICIFLAILTFMTLVLLYFLVPKSNLNNKKVSTPEIINSFQSMFHFCLESRFWMVAPIIITSQGVMFSYLYLWVGPWMRDVAKLDEVDVGMNMLFAFTGAALGYFLNGLVAELSIKTKKFSMEKLYLIFGVGLTIFLGIIVVKNDSSVSFIWVIVMFFANMTMIAFPLMQKLYASCEVGRALSLLNFTIFLMSFIFQWFIGVVLDFYPVVDGRFSAQGYQ
ncbi:MAG: MFS transporter, partial [Synergistaceae bacterium]|nr:MFS transporter [Acholeplasmataceae bacterium]MDD3318465.1 MFS transporter [Synergistaceae bacterium]MDD3672545.1 MFS transporter [Synergistaceae bacterium]